MIGKINGITHSNGTNQNFGARFSIESAEYLGCVKEQAQQSDRMEEYNAAKRTLAFNFPRGEINKLKSRSNTNVFMFKPNDPIQIAFSKDKKNPTAELDSFIKLANAVRNISW